MFMSENRLALEGGIPTISEGLLPSWPSFDEDTINAAVEPLRSGKVNYWTGELGMEFERRFAAWNGSKFCISTTSGTSALHTAIASLGVGPGDQVIVPSYTFIATSFCVVQAGAIPVFADVRRESHCIDPDDVEAKTTERTKAVIPVHLYGNICEMDGIMEVARKHGIYVVEDCAEAHGALFKGRKVGTIGHAGCFSFCQNKTFTTGGEGGAVTTNDEDLAWRCRSFRDHGYDVEKRLSLLEAEGTLPYIHTVVGYNYRMTEMQSAIGLKALEKIDAWNLPRRRRNGEVLIEELEDCDGVLTLPVHTEEKVNGFYVFPVVLDLERLTASKTRILEAMTAEGLPVWREFWPQCYKERAFTEHNGFGSANFPFESQEYTDPASVRYGEVNCPNAAWLEERTFIVHCYPTLEEEHMRLIARGIRKVLERYRR
jgi:dTDP-4-amino-4,6-dideoxygalactose transaminase